MPDSLICKSLKELSKEIFAARIIARKLIFWFEFCCFLSETKMEDNAEYFNFLKFVKGLELTPSSTTEKIKKGLE